MEKIKDNKFIKSLLEDGKTNIFILVGFIGILLVTLGNPVSQEGESKEAPTLNENSLDEYINTLETDLQLILSSVEGAGTVEVMITLESSWENVYVSEEKSQDENFEGESVKSSYESSFVLIDGYEEETALVKTVLEPSIKGVVVVSKGAGDISVISDITSAVQVALDVPSNRICVVKMQ